MNGHKMSITANKAGRAGVAAAIATLVATRTPVLCDLPAELTIPIILGLIRAGSNIVRHRWGIDLFQVFKA